MNKILSTALIALLSITLFIGCGSSSSEKSVNLVFVVSPDLAYNTPGDIQPDTANLTSQGLNRSLQMATYLKETVLGSKNATSIYALSAMTHLQTSNNYPDMTSIGYIQPFALLNQITLPISTTSTYPANSFPIKMSYTVDSLPQNVSVPSAFCSNCSGLDFNNSNGSNDTLVSDLITKKISGFHVFSAPWETISAMMNYINVRYGYNLNLPNAYNGSNTIYAISIPEFGSTSLKVYDSNLNPSTSYPELPKPVVSAVCNNPLQEHFISIRTGGVNGVVVPSNANKNQTVYIVRHAEAHPDEKYKFENGNFVAAGQWRALGLSRALKGKINPDMVYSIDPAQWFHHPLYGGNYSYVRPSLTVLPYAIDNNLPYFLVSNFQLMTAADDNVTAKNTSDFFFTGGTFSNKTLLLGWESGHIRPLLKYLLETYGGTNVLGLDITLPNTGWPGNDYDTIWRVTLDAQGNLSVDNDLCEGIDSVSLPITAPIF